MSLYDDYKSGGGNFFDPGTHRVRVSAVLKYKNVENRDVLKVTFGFGENKIDDRLSLGAKARWKIGKLVAACGMNEQTMRTMEADDPRLHKWLIGRQLMIVVAKKPPDANGKQYSEVREYQPIKAGSASPPPPISRDEQADEEFSQIDDGELPPPVEDDSAVTEPKDAPPW